MIIFVAKISERDQYKQIFVLHFPDSRTSRFFGDALFSEEDKREVVNVFKQIWRNGTIARVREIFLP